MCTLYYTTKIFTCGDPDEVDVNVDRCDNPSKPGYQVKRLPMGSRREAKKCGKYGCRNP